MIAKLKGIVDSTGDDWAVIDVGGVGYLVFCSSRTLENLRVGEAASLLIETHVREDHIHLFGFFSTEEKQWFLLLTSVQGVGVKVGLAILSALTADDLMQAIAASDKVALTRAAGVGPKLAARIASELKDKTGKILPSVDSVVSTTSGKADVSSDSEVSHIMEDAVSALVNLGYQRMDAFSAVGRAVKKQEGDVSMQGLIREALKEFAQKDS